MNEPRAQRRLAADVVGYSRMMSVKFAIEEHLARLSFQNESDVTTILKGPERAGL